MWDKIKAYWATLYSWDEPIEETPSQGILEDEWGFVMHTAEYDGQYEFFPERISMIKGTQEETTWLHILDQVIDVLSEHYGYDIKSQVYYAVQFPTNSDEVAGFERQINYDILQQLLLAYPEAYHPNTLHGFKL